MMQSVATQQLSSNIRRDATAVASPLRRVVPADGVAGLSRGMLTCRGRMVCRAANEDAPAQNAPVTGIIFNPWEAMEGELSLVQQTVGTGLDVPKESLARCLYHPELESAVNQQINVEYNNSYIYHAMYSFFARDNVGLPGFAKYFKEQSEEERGHAEKLMNQQNKRGGRVILGTIMAPATTEFYHDEKGAALWAMELSLALEKLNFQKLRDLHDVAVQHNDAEMCHYIEDYLLHEQAADVYRVASYVSQLRQVGKGHGTWHFDRYLYDGEGDKLALSMNGA